MGISIRIANSDSVLGLEIGECDLGLGLLTGHWNWNSDCEWGLEIGDWGLGFGFVN